MKGKPILCLDFDGVLHSYTSGWQGADVISDPPVKGAKEFLAKATKHFRVVIFSSRTHQLGGRAAMFKWCVENFTEEIAGHLGFPEYKFSAFITIDDRALQFNGVFPDVENLLDFKPWNKR